MNPYPEETDLLDWVDYDRRHPTPTSEEWLREIASNGMPMSVSLRGQHCADCSTRGDLYPEDIANVLALLDASRADLRAALERLDRP